MHLYTRIYASGGDLVAAAATALPVLSAGPFAIRYAHRRRSGSGSLAGSAEADETATALRVPRAVLADALTPRTVGRSLTTDAKRCKRAPNNGSTHQPERLTSGEGAFSQSSSEIVEEAIFSGHRLSPFPEGRDSSAPPCYITPPH